MPRDLFYMKIIEVTKKGTVHVGTKPIAVGPEPLPHSVQNHRELTRNTQHGGARSVFQTTPPSSGPPPPPPPPAPATRTPPPALIALTMLPEGHGGKSTPDELLAGKWQGGLVCHEHVPTRSNHRQMFVGHGHSDGPHDHHIHIFTPPPSRHKSPERGPRSWRRLPQGHRQPLLGHTPVGVWHARWSRVRF